MHLRFLLRVVTRLINPLTKTRHRGILEDTATCGACSERIVVLHISFDIAQPERDDSETSFKSNVWVKSDKRLKKVRPENKEPASLATGAGDTAQTLSPVPADRLPAPDLVEKEEMAAVNSRWPAVAPERPSTASWDDLMTRSRRTNSFGDSMHSENELRRRPRDSSNPRPYSTAFDSTQRVRPRGRIVERPSSSGVDYIVTGRTHSNSPVRRPAQPRAMTHHPDQRMSSGFANHISSVNGNPSPLRSSDSMPELNLGASPEKITYATEPRLDHRAKSSNRPSMHSRPSRLAESISMADLEKAQMTSEPQTLNTTTKTEGRMRATSWHGKHPREPTPFQPEALPGAPMKNLDSGWQHRTGMVEHMRRKKAAPNELFDKLPLEVLTIIMGHLKPLHLERSNSCATCWLRDCCSIALCNRKWLKASRDVQYEDIQLIGPDSAQQRKKYKGVYCTRLILLRRTLRANLQLAAMVRLLKVPALPDDTPVVAYHDIVASVVRACPSLERLDGFYPSYNHSESRLFTALTTRTHLKEMTWVIDAASTEEEVEHGHKAKSSKSKNRHSRHQSSVSTLSLWKYLPAALANKFVRHHMSWSQLTHLTIHCLPGAQLNTPNTLLNVVQTYLTSLQSLYLSYLPPNAFNDTTLIALPRPLKKLALSHCHGVTTSGLSTFATSTSAQSLETLTLIHQHLDTLPAVVRLLANLTNLTRFSLVQSTAPTMPDDELIWLMPYLGSRSLRFLHWDVFESSVKDRKGGMPGTKTDDILARSIAARGFPNLRFLRVPCDPNGMFQALCRPKERIGLPGDRYRNDPVRQASSSALRSLAIDSVGNGKVNTTINRPYASTGTLGPYSSSAISLVLPSASDSSFDDRPGSSLSNDSSAKSLPVREAGSDLHRARMLAQARLEAARGFPLFEATITDEEGSVIESTGLAGFLGDVKSNTIYTLAPDLGASDERGGLVGIMDLLSDGGEDLFGRGEEASRSGAGYGTGCVGSEHVRAQALEDEAAETAAKGKAKSKSKGKIAKINKDNSTDQGATKVKEGCTGRWNSYNNENFTMDRNSGDRWAHAERGRWRGRVELS